MNEDVAGELLKIAREIRGETWALPNSSSKIVKLAQLIRSLKAGEWPSKGEINPVTDALYPLVGNDALFDSIDSAGRMYLSECARHIESAIKKLAAMPESGFRDPKDYAGLQQMLKHL